MHLICAKRSIMNQLHVHCDISDIVREYLIGVKINPYKSYRWHEVSKVARNRNGTKSPTSTPHYCTSTRCPQRFWWSTSLKLNNTFSFAPDAGMARNSPTLSSTVTSPWSAGAGNVTKALAICKYFTTVWTWHTISNLNQMKLNLLWPFDVHFIDQYDKWNIIETCKNIKMIYKKGKR